MASEATHLSALDDCLSGEGLAEDLVAFLRRPECRESARLGAVFVDLPYFRSFLLRAARYALRLPQAAAAWGERLHREKPVALARRWLEAGLGLGFPEEEAGRRLVAFGLGAFTHISIDTETHFHVNQMARERARRDGGAEADHHQSIEKMQSLFFHQDRLGYDLLARPEVQEYLRVETAWLLGDAAILGAVLEGHRAVLGAAPQASDLRAWHAGYRHYAWFAGSALSRYAVSDEERAEEYARVYEGPGFSYSAVYRAAMVRCRRDLGVAWAAVQGEPFDEAAVPERSIDDPDLRRLP